MKKSRGDNLVVKNGPIKEVIEFLNHGCLETREVLVGRWGCERWR